MRISGSQWHAEIGVHTEGTASATDLLLWLVAVPNNLKSRYLFSAVRKVRNQNEMYVLNNIKKCAVTLEYCAVFSTPTSNEKAQDNIRIQRSRVRMTKKWNSYITKFQMTNS
jgi:hypothetical protein